ncbi:MAG: putative molybdenum carrier protein [Verrucomicrobiota bacterium]|nr:putative molybdenum carrier protein [Verrucomicrobiota bacterium]
MTKISKIISGGETGADRGALDAAMDSGVEHGGWCPKGRLAEDEQIPEKYKLEEMDSEAFILRSEKNVKESDATIVFSFGALGAASLTTKILAKNEKKPYLVVDLNKDDKKNLEELTEFCESIGKDSIVLHISGTRAGNAKHIHEHVQKIVSELIKTVN